jgi:hypothetical protein
MSSRQEFDTSTALYEEAVAMYEAAKVEFEALQETIADRLRSGTGPTSTELDEEERVRANLFFARVRLSRRTSPTH